MALLSAYVSLQNYTSRFQIQNEVHNSQSQSVPCAQPLLATSMAHTTPSLANPLFDPKSNQKYLKLLNIVSCRLPSGHRSTGWPPHLQIDGARRLIRADDLEHVGAFGHLLTLNLQVLGSGHEVGATRAGGCTTQITRLHTGRVPA